MEQTLTHRSHWHSGSIQKIIPVSSVFDGADFA
jgi:hypothetical protein